MISITLNGKPREMERPQPVTDLLAALEVNPRQVAVAVNGEVITRDSWPRVTVREGDVVEIVRAVGGGAPEMPSSSSLLPPSLDTGGG